LRVSAQGPYILSSRYPSVPGIYGRQTKRGVNFSFAHQYLDLLKNQAVPVEVLSEGEARVTVTFVGGDTIWLAVRQSSTGPPG
jgi:hypothetical protein